MNGYIYLQDQVIILFQRAVHATQIPVDSDITAGMIRLRKIGKFNFKMGGLRFELLLHLLKNTVKIMQITSAMKSIENLHKTAHVGSFEPVRQIDIHVHRGHGVLNTFCPVEDGDRIGNRLHPDLADIYTPVIAQILNILH